MRTYRPCRHCGQGEQANSNPRLQELADCGMLGLEGHHKLSCPVPSSSKTAAIVTLPLGAQRRYLVSLLSDDIGKTNRSVACRSSDVPPLRPSSRPFEDGGVHQLDGKLSDRTTGTSIPASLTLITLWSMVPCGEVTQNFLRQGRATNLGGSTNPSMPHLIASAFNVPPFFDPSIMAASAGYP